MMPPSSETTAQPTSAIERQSNGRDNSTAQPEHGQQPAEHVEHRQTGQVVSTVHVAADVEHEQVLLHVGPHLGELLRVADRLVQDQRLVQPTVEARRILHREHQHRQRRQHGRRGDQIPNAAPSLRGPQRSHQPGSTRSCPARRSAAPASRCTRAARDRPPGPPRRRLSSVRSAPRARAARLPGWRKTAGRWVPAEARDVDVPPAGGEQERRGQSDAPAEQLAAHQVHQWDACRADDRRHQPLRQHRIPDDRLAAAIR